MDLGHVAKSRHLCVSKNAKVLDRTGAQCPKRVKCRASSKAQWDETPCFACPPRLQAEMLTQVQKARAKVGPACRYRVMPTFCRCHLVMTPDLLQAERWALMARTTRAQTCARGSARAGARWRTRACWTTLSLKP